MQPGLPRPRLIKHCISGPYPYQPSRMLVSPNLSRVALCISSRGMLCVLAWCDWQGVAAVAAEYVWQGERVCVSAKPFHNDMAGVSFHMVTECMLIGHPMQHVCFCQNEALVSGVAVGCAVLAGCAGCGLTLSTAPCTLRDSIMRDVVDLCTTASRAAGLMALRAFRPFTARPRPAPRGMVSVGAFSNSVMVDVGSTLARAWAVARPHGPPPMIATSVQWDACMCRKRAV